MLIFCVHRCGDGKVFSKSDGFITNGTTARSPVFKAFRLMGSNLLVFECNFTVCFSNCDGVSSYTQCISVAAWHCSHPPLPMPFTLSQLMLAFSLAISGTICQQPVLLHMFFMFLRCNLFIQGTNLNVSLIPLVLQVSVCVSYLQINADWTCFREAVNQ